MLTVQDITYKAQDKILLERISFEVQKGEILPQEGFVRYRSYDQNGFRIDSGFKIDSSSLMLMNARLFVSSDNIKI